MQDIPDEAPKWVTGGNAGIAYGTHEPKPERLTMIIGGAADMLAKLEYERDIFYRAHHANPPEVQGIVFGMLNVALAGQAMYDWFKADMELARGDAFVRKEFDEEIAARLPYHPMCRDIANTLKHARYRAETWVDGRVKLDYLPGDGKVAPLANLLLHEGGDNWIEALVWTRLVASNWRELLLSHGLIPDIEAS